MDARTRYDNLSKWSPMDLPQFQAARAAWRGMLALAVCTVLLAWTSEASDRERPSRAARVVRPASGPLDRILPWKKLIEKLVKVDETAQTAIDYAQDFLDDISRQRPPRPLPFPDEPGGNQNDRLIRIVDAARQEVAALGPPVQDPLPPIMSSPAQADDHRRELRTLVGVLIEREAALGEVQLLVDDLADLERGTERSRRFIFQLSQRFLEAALKAPYTPLEVVFGEQWYTLEHGLAQALEAHRTGIVQKRKELTQWMTTEKQAIQVGGTALRDALAAEHASLLNREATTAAAAALLEARGAALRKEGQELDVATARFTADQASAQAARRSADAKRKAAQARDKDVLAAQRRLDATVESMNESSIRRCPRGY
ncbi:hypothetical protein [Gemmatimonas sp. UBA7669]|uniref:hypothetical protein n=1 Tax=Gemmatimonas sp. UBA7669 TaxID=1946568 RepID=UPI0025C10B08|nr:hypothetical protein [Gemmatimonas sp. UBA7669]